jgi:dinuclear metal center YbgI/SA1388 family protein
MHTNFDVMGMADAVADELGLKRKSVLDVTYEDDISKEGIGRIGLLPREVSLKELAETVKIKFHIPNVMLYGEGDTIVEKVAICGGSGSYAIKNAIQAGCQVYITGDITYHKALDAMEEGLSIIDAGHFGIEKLFIPYMKDFFAKELKQITVMCSEQRQIGTVI